MILPGATLGMLGGGQLGRMFTLAARTLGYHVMVLDPDPNSPAGLVADEHVHATFGDDWALERLANSCAAVTTEFENVPAQALRTLARRCPVRPSAEALERTQDRILEKSFLTEIGLPTAPFVPVRDHEALQSAASTVMMPALLKRSSLGYDGKGQLRVTSIDEIAPAYNALGALPCVLEAEVELAREISVILARSCEGHTSCFPVAENVHKRGVLQTSIIPARVSDELAAKARTMALQVAESLDYCGVMAVELFVTRGGELLINEIAPRPHNSGHYTIDACVTSQFEQQVRTACGLPLGDTRLLSPVVMVNLLGDLWSGGEPDWSQVLDHPNAKLHLYGKREARPGRKMGHFTCLEPNVEAALRLGESILETLSHRERP